MNFILRFLLKSKVFWVFIFLEVLSIYIISNRSVFQRSLLSQQFMTISASVNETMSNWASYFALRSANDELSSYNAELQTEVGILKSTIEEFVANGNHIEFENSKYHFVSAKVIDKSLQGIDNYFIINRGSKDGIRDGLGVVSMGGVVGVVTNVTDNYSTIMLVISSKFPISAKLKIDSTLCSVQWDGRSKNLADINGIPTHIEVKAGDTIYTSGFSSIFPDNYLVGIVTDMKHNVMTSSKDLKMLYSVDFQKIRYVDIIFYEHQEELNQIIEKLE